MKKFIIISIFFFSVFWARAQNEGELLLRARVVEDKIYLRWGSNNPDLIKVGQKSGFLLTKSGSNGENNVLDIIELKMDDPRTWQSDDEQVDVVKQAFAQMEKDNSDLNLIDQINLQNNVFALTLFMADISAEAARYTATGFIDIDVSEGYEYSYTLSIPSLQNISSNRLTISLDDTYENQAIKNILPKGSDLKANLIWDFSELKEVYSCYIIERSDDNGRSFNRVSSAPFLPILNYDLEEPVYIANYEDDLEENGKEYFYRVSGIDFFAQQGPFSEPVKVIGRPPPLAMKASFDRILQQDDGTFEISWYLQEKWEKKIQGFQILRSTDGKQSFQKVGSLLGPSQRSIIDDSPSNIAFYKVITIDENDYELESSAGMAQKRDNTPPEAPIWKEGYIDTSGAVFLYWEENTEEDLGGYHVFYANAENAEYSKLTNSAELEINEYIDSIEVMTLTKDIYYKLMAIDFRGNQSAYSEPLKLTRPDLIPPSPPVFKSCEQEVDKIQINFANSSSDDVANTFLQRKRDAKDWETIFNSSKRGGNELFYDTTSICSETYLYRLYSQDESGLMSYSDTISLSCIDSGKRPDIKDIELTQVENSIQLKWEYDFYDKVKSVMVYRKEQGDKLRKVEQLWSKEITAKNQRQYVDKDVKEGKSYAYKVILRFDDNGFASSNESSFFKLKKN